MTIVSKLNWRPHAALLLVNILYGAGYSIARIPLNGYITPGVFIAIRVSISIILFTVFAALYLKNPFYIERKHIPRFIACGIFGVAINQICFFEGLSRTSEMNASLLMILTPILILVMAFVLKEISFSWLRILGVSLGCMGAYIIMRGKGAAYTMSSKGFYGDIFILINAFSYSLYLVLVKKLMRTYEPLKVILFVFIIGWIPVLAYATPQVDAIQWYAFTPIVWLSILFISVFVTFLVYLLNIYAIHKSDATLAGIYIYVQPLFAALFAYVINGNRIQNYHIIAAIFIFVGLYLAGKKTNAHSK